MSLLRNLFGPSREEAWRQLCTEIGADYVKGRGFQGSRVEARLNHWTITLDTYTVSTGKSSVTYTRIRAPYRNPAGFRFKIYRKGIFSGLAKKLGMQDIEVGCPEFDEGFIIQGTDAATTADLFASDLVRRLLAEQPAVYLEVKDDEGIWKKVFPEGVDELYFQVTGVIKDVDRLKGLFLLFAAILTRLQELGCADPADPGVQVK